MMNKIAKVPMNDELAGIDAALRRAAKAAHALARKTKTPCYIWKDGQIVDMTAKQNKSSQGKLIPSN
jgi:hypothetical protein